MLQEFDFESEIEKLLPKISPDYLLDNNNNSFGNFKVDQKLKSIVCRHWLLGLCHNGLDCTYLHKLDKRKMPACKHGKLCKIKNCPLKHVADEEIEECLFYKQGFCYNGPKCGRRHVKRMPEECPMEPSFEQVVSSGQTLPSGKKPKTSQPNDNYKVTLCTHWLLSGTCTFDTECHFAHGEEEINEGYQANSEFLRDDDIYDPTAYKLDCPLELPFPPSTTKCCYFLLQSPDLRSLAIAKQRGVWSIPNRMVNEINSAYRTQDFVILYFSVRSMRGLYGIAKLAGLVPLNTVPSPMTPEFPITWMRSLRISMRTIAQLKLGNTGMFVGRCTVDGKFENKVGMDILLTAYRKPVWEWSLELERAEANIRVVDRSNGVSNVSSYGMPGEYYPVDGKPAMYTLPPDVLFAQDWIERAALAIPDKFSGQRGNVNSTPMNNYQPQGFNHVPEFYTGEFPGFVFCANTPTVEEMFSRLLVGLPIQMKDVKIFPNVPLFICDTQLQVLYGVFHPASETVPNIEPMAFISFPGNPPVFGPDGMPISMLPIQLRFKIALEAPPIPLADPELLATLGEAKPMGVLPAKETRALSQLFAKRVAAVFANNNPTFAMNKQNPNSRTKFKGPSAGPVGAENNSGGLYYKPPFKYVEVIPIDISGSIFEIKKKLLGTNASNIIQIVDELGSKHCIRIRMRGQGSGFYEGPNNAELPEPLHFNVSADSEVLLKNVCQRVRMMIDHARHEIQGGVIGGLLPS